MESVGDITELLRASGDGDDSALHTLFQLIYDDLKIVARHRRSGERIDHTLQTTALVHEAFLRLSAGNLDKIGDRDHLMALASRVMRHILVDYARMRKASKRGIVDPLEAENFSLIIDPSVGLEMLDLDRALNSICAEHPRLVQVVECRFFAGMTAAETANALEVSERTVERDWFRAKAYLYQHLQAGSNESEDSESGWRSAIRQPA